MESGEIEVSIRGQELSLRRDRLYHLLAGSSDDPDRGLEGEVQPTPEGFVHLSQATQVAETTERYFDSTLPLILVEFDPGRFESELRWEEAGRDEKMPHLYGPLCLDDQTARYVMPAQS